ncbi:MAG: DNA-processing protein DprA [Armatimonadota bacterium]
MTEGEAWLALNAAELPPRTVLALVDHYGSAASVIAAGAAVRDVARLTEHEAIRLSAAARRDYQREFGRLKQSGVRLVTIRDAEYPANLRQIYDPPPVLFVRGSFMPCDERAVAIVGTRRVTPYGRLVTETLARELAQRQVTVVSGMAVGADAAAHRGALSAGGRTIGVLACGVDVPYPRDTMELREQAVERGAVMSEVPPGTGARPGRFTARNRLISGLALGVVVTEAPEQSGALITANTAANQGRQVFAVPGSVNSEFSRGTHALLRDGARLVESVDDILAELALPEAAPIAPKPTPAATQEVAREAPPASDLTPDETVILDALSLQQRHVDQIIEDCRVPANRASASLLMLELKGLVRRLPGNMFMRVR